MLTIRLFGLKMFVPVPHVEERCKAVPDVIGGLDADVVCLSEVFDESHRRYIHAELASIYPYVQDEDLGDPALGVGSGLMILSKRPLCAPLFHPYSTNNFEEGLLARRGVLMAAVELPGGKMACVMNTHLIAGGLFGHPESAGMEAIRTQQITELRNVRRRVAPGAVCIMGGDFNCGPQASPKNYRHVCCDLEETYGTVGDDPQAVTWDPLNELSRTGPHRRCPPQRIDHILVQTAGTGYRTVSSRIVCTSPVVGLANGSKVTASDHYGVLTHLRRQ